MAKADPKLFTTEESDLLLWLSEHETKTRDGSLIKFSQSELAQELACSPTSVNKRMQGLCRSGCIEKYRTRGNYCITDRGRKIIAEFKKIESILAGGQ